MRGKLGADEPEERRTLEKVEAGRLPSPPGLCGINLNTARSRGVLVDNNQSLSRSAHGGVTRPSLLAELVRATQTSFNDPQKNFNHASSSD
jgi:hypothetical protein